MTLPQTNVRLTKVDGSSTGEGFEGPEARGAQKWAGSVGAYLRERRERRRSGEGEDRVMDRLLIVENANPPIDWATGDWVDFERAGTPLTGRVELVDRREIDDADIPAELETTRLTLALV